MFLQSQAPAVNSNVGQQESQFSNQQVSTCTCTCTCMYLYTKGMGAPGHSYIFVGSSQVQMHEVVLVTSVIFLHTVHTCLLLRNFQHNSCCTQPGQHSHIQAPCSPGCALQLLYMQCTSKKLPIPICRLAVLMLTFFLFQFAHRSVSLCYFVPFCALHWFAIVVYVYKTGRR